MEQEQTNGTATPEAVAGVELETEPTPEDGTSAEGLAGEAPPTDLIADLTEELKKNWGRDRDVSLAELDGLPVFEQFLKIWGTPERGKVLWDVWYRTQNPMGRMGLDALVANAAEEYGVSEDEARVRMAVEKFVTDRGANVAAKYVDAYKARKLRLSRPLKPMLPQRKRKR